MTYNRSHSRFLRHGRFSRLIHSKQFLSFLTTQAARLTAVGKTFTVKSTLAGVKATGVLTTDATAPADTSTIVIGSKTYTWQTTLTNTDGHVLIGISVATAYANLASAINLTAGAGTTYAAATTANAAATSAVAAATTVTVTATVPGSAGNAFSTTTGGTPHSSWGNTTLTGGIDIGGGNGSQFTSTAHGFTDLQGPFLTTNSGGALPAGLTATQQYWVHKVDADTLQLSPSKEGIINGVGIGNNDDTGAFVAVTTIGTGTQTIKRDVLTKKGVFEVLKVNKVETVLGTTTTASLK